MSQFFTILNDTFTQFWDERQGRERQYIIAAVIVVVFTLVYLIVIDPALTGREELSKSLPTLHQQAAEMQRMAQELESLPPLGSLQDVSRDFIEASLTSSNLKTQSLSVADGVVRAQISSTSMASLQAWLLQMQKSSGLFVEDIKITGLEGGLVSANLALRQSTSGG